MTDLLRRPLHDPSGVEMGLALEGTLDREHAAIVTRARWRSLRVSLDDRPLLWAHSDVYGFDWVPAPDGAPHVLPPFDAADARAMARRREASPAAWLHRLAAPLGSMLLSRRTPVAWLAIAGSSDRSALRRARKRAQRVDYVPGAVQWDGIPVSIRSWPEIDDGCVLPCRPWPRESDGRVKAYRKLAREGALPPVVLLWLSGLQSWLVLDGHARWIALQMEPTGAHVVGIVRPTPRLRSLSAARRANLLAAHRVLEELARRRADEHDTRWADGAREISATLDEPTCWDAIDRASPLDHSRFEAELTAAEGIWRARSRRR